MNNQQKAIASLLKVDAKALEFEQKLVEKLKSEDTFPVSLEIVVHYDNSDQLVIGYKSEQVLSPELLEKLKSLSNEILAN